jgi:hypothetical protein
MYII